MISVEVKIDSQLLTVLRAEARQYGLLLRGAFAPQETDGVPALACGSAARTLALFGNAGSSLWEAFAGSPEIRDGALDPLDRWSRRIAEDMAKRFGGEALFPFGGPPHHPFLRWARKAEALLPSPVGMFIHPQYGLWHAYRFALAFAQPLEERAAPAMAQSPCAGCSTRLCLGACPAGAFTGDVHRIERCVGYLEQNPHADCWRRGCRVRQACPVGEAYRYLPAQAEFHMRAFFAKQAPRYRSRDC